MAYNVPTVDTTDISFGPGVVYMDTYAAIQGPTGTGADPTTQVGSITEDGVTFEFQRESKAISQGNPRVPIMYFDQANNMSVTFTKIEWNLERLIFLLGSGTVSGSSAAPPVTMKWGGDPVLTEMAILIKHQSAMLESDTTYAANSYINIRVWKAVPTENLSIQMAQDEHQFAASFMALRVDSEWDAGVTLSSGQQLCKVTWGAAS